jgi:3-oxoacyl-[acyl-carrier-protein] synthase I
MEPLAAYRDLISQETLDKEINQIVCLNYGFGGTNSAMAISRDN